MTEILNTQNAVQVARRKATIIQDELPLMGAQEAALALGVKQSNLRDQSGLPKPFQTLACGSIWLTQDILNYREHRRLNPPRPGPRKGYKQQRKAAAA